MPVDLSIPSSAIIVLWVEDALTRDYLRVIWEETPEIAFRIAGGMEGVKEIVKVFNEGAHENVFGLIDRDFQKSNQSKWLDRTKRLSTFILPVHEIENYLLDSKALQASRFQNRRLASEAIEEHMVEEAKKLCWWAACRDVIAQIKSRFRDGFILRSYAVMVRRPDFADWLRSP